MNLVMENGIGNRNGNCSIFMDAFKIYDLILIYDSNKHHLILNNEIIIIA